MRDGIDKSGYLTNGCARLKTGYAQCLYPHRKRFETVSGQLIVHWRSIFVGMYTSVYKYMSYM